MLVAYVAATQSHAKRAKPPRSKQNKRVKRAKRGNLFWHVYELGRELLCFLTAILDAYSRQMEIAPKPGGVFDPTN